MSAMPKREKVKVANHRKLFGSVRRLERVLHAIAFLLVFLWPCMTLANPIRIQIEKIQAGSITVTRDNTGTEYMSQFLGRVGRSFVVRTLKKEGEQWVVIGKAKYNSDGQITSTTIGNETFRYRPHYCTRVEGVCHYTAHASGGRQEKRYRIGEVTADGFVSRDYTADGQLRSTLTAEIDEYGLIKSQVLTVEGYPPLRSRRTYAKFE